MRLLYFVLFSLLISCSLIQPSRGPAQSKDSEESIFKAQIPLKTFKEGIQKLSEDSDFVQEVYRVDMDPVTRILALGMRINYPLKALMNFQQETGTNIAETHDLDIEIAFPASKSLTKSGYLRLQFKKFKVDGKSYLNHFQLVSDMARTILANTSLVHYLYDKTTTDDEGENYRAMLTEVLENNGIVVFSATRTLAVKINPKNFEQLRFLSHLQDLKLWVLSPFLLKGTDEVFFRIEAGIGNPDEAWSSDMESRMTADNSRLLEERRDLYRQYSNLSDLERALNSYLNDLLARESIKESKLSQIHKNNLSTFRSSFTSEAREILTTSNDSFKANPENEYLQYLESKKSDIRSFVVDLDRKLAIDSNVLAGGNPQNKDRPFLVKKISQDILSAGMNFLKDGTSWIKESNLVIAPHLPGVVFKGVIGVPLEELLAEEENGLILRDGLANLTPVQNGIPFKLVVETKTGDDGWLALDAKSITLFDGPDALRFDRTDSNDKFFLDLLKLTVVQSLAGLSFELDKGDGLSAEERKELKRKKIKAYLESLRSSYTVDTRSDFIKNIARAINTDIDKNPFSSAGEDYANAKKEILYGKLFKYDPKDKLFKIQLDPKIIADNIQGARNDIQVWNVSPLFLEEQNNTYLELSAGKGKRGSDFVKKLHARQNSRANAGFTGLRDDHNRSSADVIATLNFDYLEAAANQILKEMAQANNGDYQERLKKDEEQTHYIIDSLSIDVISSRVINLELNATKLSKAYKGFWLWKKWKTERESYGITAQISLEAKNIEKIKPYLREHKDKVYFSDQTIALKIHNARVKFGKKSLINTALNAMAKVNLDGAIGSRVRSFALKLVNGHFLKSYTENKTGVLGQELDQFGRVLATEDEIVLLLNPRMSGAAFELSLAGDEDFVKEALRFDPANQELNVYLSGSPSMAKTDKKDLLNIVQDAQALFSPLLAKGKWPLYHALKNPGFAEKAVYDNDKSKRSLYNRLLVEIRTYDQVLNSVNIPLKAPNSKKRISSCGAELMYFAGASFALYHGLDRIIAKVEEYGLEDHVHRFATLVEARNKLYHNIITPLFRTYTEGYHRQNSLIKKSKESHWNMNFYPDAYFAETIHQFLGVEEVE